MQKNNNLLKILYYKIIKTYYKILNEHKKDNKLLVLGNQKAGTSVIANLLAERAGLNKTIDIPEIRFYENDLNKGKLSIEKFICQNPHRFSQKLIKENCLTFLYDDLKTVFPNSNYIFITRHPLDNIRSILDRVGIQPQKLPIKTSLVNQLDVNDTWKRILRGDLISYNESKYIHIELAYRWIAANKIYLNNKNEFELVRYEDFIDDKLFIIDELCSKLKLDKKNSIKEKCDIQFQPKGANRNKSVIKLFPKDIIFQVEKLCETEMKMLNYTFYSKELK